MTGPAPDLLRGWLFGPGADALILDLEDFTPPARRPEARALMPRWRAA